MDGEIITAQLAFVTNARRDPPNRRVIEKERLHDHLQDIDEIIVPANVRDLVREQCFELLGGEAHRNRSGQQDHGPNPSHNARHFRNRRHQHSQLAPHAKTPGKIGHNRVDGPIRRCAPAAQCCGVAARPCKAERK